MASRGVKPDDVIGQDAERLQAGVLPGRAGDDGVDAAAPQVIEPVPYIIAGLAVSNDEDYRLPVPLLACRRRHHILVNAPREKLERLAQHGAAMRLELRH